MWKWISLYLRCEIYSKCNIEFIIFIIISLWHSSVRNLTIIVCIYVYNYFKLLVSFILRFVPVIEILHFEKKKILPISKLRM